MLQGAPPASETPRPLPARASTVREKLLVLGNEVLIMNPAQFRKFVENQVGETARIFKAAGIKPQ